jgi:murein DD-endopeptidase MepM/ murein hydrolase activator NlpD
MSKSLAQRDMLGISDMLKKELLGKINESSQVNRNLTMPAIGRITSKFGTREHPITHKMSHHDGIDISLKEGTPIKASMGGKVIFSGEKSGYGNVIIVKSGDYETIYGHCSELLFNKGDNIKKGEKIALSGNTGVSTGPHLHFEIRKKGKAIDPFTLIK